MSLLHIYTYPDKVLTQKSKPIESLTDQHKQLAANMLETMYAAPGIGLAANQVGITERMVVVDTDYDYEPAEEKEHAPSSAKKYGSYLVWDTNPRVFINPVIIQKTGKTAISEGCLSVPEYNAEVDRSEKIELRYLDLEGKEQTLQAEGLLAICIQHELDHLDGRLFIDRLSPLKKEMAQKQLLKERKERELLLAQGSELTPPLRKNSRRKEI